MSSDKPCSSREGLCGCTGRPPGPSVNSWLKEGRSGTRCLKRPPQNLAKASVLEKTGRQTRMQGIWESSFPAASLKTHRQPWGKRSLSFTPLWSYLRGCLENNVHPACGCEYPHLPEDVFLLVGYGGLKALRLSSYPPPSLGSATQEEARC